MYIPVFVKTRVLEEDLSVLEFSQQGLCYADDPDDWSWTFRRLMHSELSDEDFVWADLLLVLTEDGRIVVGESRQYTDELVERLLSLPMSERWQAMHEKVIEAIRYGIDGLIPKVGIADQIDLSSYESAVEGLVRLLKSADPLVFPYGFKCLCDTLYAVLHSREHYPFSSYRKVIEYWNALHDDEAEPDGTAAIMCFWTHI